MNLWNNQKNNMKKKIIWYTAWVFDLFHIWHLNILKNAKNLCDILIVGLTTDEYTFQRKWKYPIIPYQERKQILESIKYVDRVVPQDLDSLDDYVAYTLKIQKELWFDIDFKWSDAQGTEKWIRLEEALSKRGVRVVFFPYTVTTSSTLITEKLSHYEE